MRAGHREKDSRENLKCGNQMKAKKQGQAGFPGCPVSHMVTFLKLLGNAGFAKAVTEFLNATTHVVHRFLCAGVEGV